MKKDVPKLKTVQRINPAHRIPLIDEVNIPEEIYKVSRKCGEVVVKRSSMFSKEDTFVFRVGRSPF